MKSTKPECRIDEVILVLQTTNLREIVEQFTNDYPTDFIAKISVKELSKMNSNYLPNFLENFGATKESGGKLHWNFRQNLFATNNELKMH
jgi:hypothetical protein